MLVLTLFRIRLDGVESKKLIGARNIFFIMPKKSCCAVSIAIADRTNALPNINTELPADDSTKIPIIFSLLASAFVPMQSSSCHISAMPGIELVTDRAFPNQCMLHIKLFYER